MRGHRMWRAAAVAAVTVGLGLSAVVLPANAGTAEITLDGSTATVAPLPAGESALAVLPGPVVADVSVTGTLVAPAIRSGTNGLWNAVQLRHQDGRSYRAKVAFLDAGRIGVGISRVAGDGSEAYLASAATDLTASSGQRLRFEAKVRGSDPVHVAVRTWVDGTPTPPWQATAQDTSADRLTAPGAVSLWAYVSRLATGPIGVAYGDWAVRPLAAPDPAPRPTARPTPAAVATTAPPKPAPVVDGDLRGLVAAGKTTLPAGTFTFADFQDNDWGAEVANLRGAGMADTVLRMAPHTSTKAGRIPTASMSTNQLSLLTVQGGSPSLGDFTVQATDQGHLYNGLRVMRTTGAKIGNVKLVGIAGNSSSPPGETFVVNDYASTDNVYSNLVIDGQNVSAAGFGANGSTNLTINGLRSVNNKHSSAITFWKTNGATVNDLVADNNHKAVNMEQNTGTFTFNRPSFGSSAMPMDLSTFSTFDSTKVIINDPKLAPGQKIRIKPYIGATSYGGVNKQLKEDIRVYVGGVDRTADLVHWVS
ncbi:MAG TPA: hypothetical protein VF062_22445 [Candidatus Limnocylindrales bacterium]